MMKRRIIGLLLPGERKSVEPLAALTAAARTAPKHQSLLHFGFCCNVWGWVAGHLREGPVHLSSGDLKSSGDETIRIAHSPTLVMPRCTFFVRHESNGDSRVADARCRIVACACSCQG
jgi:hypothetical protein